jgi:endonuclease/exonuclease/phosphatase family metal-dependent hydrolase
MQLTDASFILAFALSACASPTPDCASSDRTLTPPEAGLRGTALDRSNTTPPPPCSSSPAVKTLRILSWNIKAGQVHGLDAVFTEIARWSADVILLQEVDVDVARSGGLDQPSILAERLAHEFVFAPTIEIGGGGLYGIAALSRVPLRGAHRIALSNSYACEARVGLDIRLCFGAEELRIVNHHADYFEPAASASIDELVNHITPATQPTIFAGDLNQTIHDEGPMSAVDAGLVDVFSQHDDGPTQGRRRIDFMFVDEKVAQFISSARVLATSASDHPALLVELRLL